MSTFGDFWCYVTQQQNRLIIGGPQLTMFCADKFYQINLLIFCFIFQSISLVFVYFSFFGPIYIVGSLLFVTYNSLRCLFFFFYLKCLSLVYSIIFRSIVLSWAQVILTFKILILERNTICHPQTVLLYISTKFFSPFPVSIILFYFL